VGEGGGGGGGRGVGVWGGGGGGDIIVNFSHIAQSLGWHTTETVTLVWSVNRFSDLPAVIFGALL